MVVTIKPASERVSKSDLAAAWGVISEHVAARDDVRKAVLLVLGYEQDIVPVLPLFDVPADVAQGRQMFAFGKREGLDRAALALLDSAYIRDVRMRLDEMNKETES